MDGEAGTVRPAALQVWAAIYDTQERDIRGEMDLILRKMPGMSAYPLCELLARRFGAGSREDAASAWHRLIARGLLPRKWAIDPRRVYDCPAFDGDACPACGAAEAEHPGDHPPSLAFVAEVARSVARMTDAEARARVVGGAAIERVVWEYGPAKDPAEVLETGCAVALYADDHARLNLETRP